MKIFQRLSLLLAAVGLLSVASCVNEVSDGSDQGGLSSNVASLSDQATAMKTSVGEMEAMLSLLNEAADLEESASLLETAVASVKEHVASIESGLSGSYAAIVTLKLQGQIAEVLGALKVRLSQIGNADFNKHITSIEKSVALWLGKDFKNYFSVVLEQTTVEKLLKIVQSQSVSVGALASDVEAGLREGDASQLGSVSEFVAKNLETLTKFESDLTALNVEIEQAYTEAIKSHTASTQNTLKSVNTKSAAALADVESTLSSLVSRVATCETEIAELKKRLTLVETDINKLLEMIQSVTFLSEFSEEKALAYYTLSVNEDPDYPGKKFRTRKGSIELSYLVRPASAVTALADMNTWTESGVELNVLAYNAEQIAVKSFANEFFNMEISSVEANAETGVLKLTVSDEAIAQSFYMKETGAKVALSLKAGKTDITSKFVEIIPKDESNTVYLESFSLANNFITLKTGTTGKIEPIFVPADATVLGYTHDFNDPQTMVIGEDGTVDARATGTYTINLTTKGVNEWGQNLTAKCTVKIEPNIQIISPGSVEVGSTAEFTIDAPEDVKLTMQNITWRMKDKANDKSQVDYNNYAGISKTSDYIATITGFSNSLDTETKTYSDVYVICEIDGTKYESTLKVLHKQPRAIIIKDAEGNNWNENSLTLKLNETSDVLEYSRLSLGPDGVDASLFRINSVVEKGGETVASINANNNHILTGSSFIGGETGTVGNATIKVTVTSDNGALFIGSPTRYVYLKVEPVYVTGLALTMAGETITGETVEVNAGSTTMAIVEYSTDKEGYEPSYKDVVWQSSDESVATVDSEGNITVRSDAGGKSCTITVTTNNEYSVLEGESQKSASFTLSATSPWNAFEIGDYVYADSNGEIQFASAADLAADPSLKDKIVGIVFAKQNPRITDVLLPSDCVHGLAVTMSDALEDGKYSTMYWSSSTNKVTDWALSNGYQSLGGYDGFYNTTTDLGKMLLGYNNTAALRAYNEANGLKSPMITSLDNYGIDLPEGASPLYVPSTKEFELIYSVKDKLDFAAAGYSYFEKDVYWTSSENSINWTCAALYYPNTGAYYQYAVQKTTNKRMRPIFAF